MADVACTEDTVATERSNKDPSMTADQSADPPFCTFRRAAEEALVVGKLLKKMNKDIIYFVRQIINREHEE